MKKSMLLIGAVMLLSLCIIPSEGVQIRKVSVTAVADDAISDTVTIRAAGADGIVKKYAIVIGISDYKAISDLSFCDEDASDWYNYLATKGYAIKLFGDGTSLYPRTPDGTATEYTIKQAIASTLAVADADDIVVFASSGHGTRIRVKAKVYQQALCMWDCSVGENGEDGLFRDTEFKTAWAVANTNVFIFLDHCYSGGMNEIFQNTNAACFYMTTTCTDNGYGYDVPAFYNGMWTYYYLELGIIGQHYVNLHDCFVWSHAEAVADGYDRGDEPQEFGTADFVL